MLFTSLRKKWITVAIFRFCDGVPRPFMHPLEILKRSSGCRPPFDKIVGQWKFEIVKWISEILNNLYYMFANVYAIAMSESDEFTEIVFSCQIQNVAHGRIQRETDPHPRKIGFLSILVRFPLKSQSYQASIRCWAISGTPAKRHLNGVWLADQWWPASSTKIKVVKVGPLSGSAHAAGQLCFMCKVRFYAPWHHVPPNS